MFTIDLGTSGPKVAIFTIDGHFVDGEFEPVDLLLFPGGGVEQRPDDWWRGIIVGAQRLMDRSPVPVDSIVAVSVTAQWSGTVPTARDGEAVYNAVIWMDSRGAKQIEGVVGGRIKVAGYEVRKLRKWLVLTGGAPAHSGKDPLAHILWLEEARPDAARATDKYLEPKDWLNLRLTGRCVGTYDSMVLHWVTDNRDPNRIRYDEGLLRVSGLDRSKLPDMVRAVDVIGTLLPQVAEELGLRPETVVIGGTGDLQSAAVGSGAVGDFEGHLYCGTSSWLSCHVPYKKTDVLHGVASLPSPLPGKYYVADEQEVAGGCLSWLSDKIIFADDGLTGPPPKDVFHRLDALAETLAPGSDGVIFTPWLNGERTPVDDHTLRSGWHNQSLGTTRAHLVRSVLEGVAYNSRWLLGAVEKFTGKRFPALNFIGGGASSRTWAQIMADVLDRPIRQVENPIRANARGAALLAGVALERITIDDITRSVTVTETIDPDPANRAVYDELYREFRNLYKRTKGVYRRLNRQH